MDLLKRSIAPILPEAWRAIEDEARPVLELNLAGRKLFDLDGPHGWQHAAVNTGRVELLDAQPVDHVHAGLRSVQRIVELRTPFVLPLMELDGIARGAENPDLDAVVHAARRIALAEDRAIFNGWKDAGITGVLEASPHDAIKVANAASYPEAILSAQEVMRRSGIDGPYALVLGADSYDELLAATENGYPVVKVVGRALIDGPIVRSSAIDGAALVSARGGDYQISIGQDLSIGYVHHDRDDVELYLTESFTFRVLEPAAAVKLKRSSKG